MTSDPNTLIAYNALCGNVAILPISCDVLRVTGQDRINVLHNILTQDIKSIGLNTSKPAALLSANGRIQSLMEVFVTSDCVFLTTQKDAGTSTQQKLERYVITEDVRFENLTISRFILCLSGPDSRRTIEPLLNCSLTEGSVWSLPQTIVLKQSLLPIPGYTLITTAKDVHEKANEIFHANEAAQNARRVELGIPKMGIDIADENLLPETGLEQLFVSWTKGCYPGQEVVARLDAYGGLQRKLIPLAIDETPSIQPGEKIFEKETQLEAGIITSCSDLPVGDKIAALGMIKKQYGASPLMLVRGAERINVTVRSPKSVKF